MRPNPLRLRLVLQEKPLVFDILKALNLFQCGFEILLRFSGTVNRAYGLVALLGSSRIDLFPLEDQDLGTRRVFLPLF
jgi:hypothetical protein